MTNHNSPFLRLDYRFSNVTRSDMFLGPAHPNFRFEPKHKSNAYNVEG
jgi:hypothetical protein